MLTIRKSSERGHAEHGWLESFHTFSFADYHDDDHMGFRALRVINEDFVQPAKGFGTHGHRDMEIVTYVLEGTLEHKDSMGNGSLIKPGDVQYMSAGTGVMHSEFNASKTEPVHFLQIWIVPEAEGLAPSYEQKSYPAEDKRGMLRLVASRDGREGSVTVHRDVDLYATLLGEGDRTRHTFRPGRAGWLQVARGTATVNDVQLYPGDGVAIEAIDDVAITGTSADTEVLLFDLAA